MKKSLLAPFRAMILFSVFLFAAGCSTVPLTGRKQLSLVSQEQVLSLSDQSFNDYMKGAKRSTNRSQVAMVQRCGQRIRNAVESYLRSTGQTGLVSGYDWDFVLVKDKTPNAFCLPGGKVVVYDGILPYTKNETGLAVVVGHEIAHAIARHSNERISQQVLIQSGGSLLDAFLGSSSSSTRAIVGQIYGLGSNYGVMLPFSRKQEYEADQLGLIFMAMAGYDPSAAVDFWTRMSQSKSGATPEFMSTHPADANRIRAIQGFLPEIKAKYYRK